MNKLTFYQQILTQIETMQTALNSLRETVKDQVQEDAAK